MPNLENVWHCASNADALGRILFEPDYGYSVTLPNMELGYSLTGDILTVKQFGATVLSYEYDVNSGSLVRVRNAATQYLELSWTNGRVTSVRDPAGNYWTYAYTTAGMLGTVTSPGTNPSVRTYYYEDAGSAQRLTGIAYSGLRYSTYAYYSDGRVQQSALAGDEMQDA